MSVIPQTFTRAPEGFTLDFDPECPVLALFGYPAFRDLSKVESSQPSAAEEESAQAVLAESYGDPPDNPEAQRRWLVGVLNKGMSGDELSFRGKIALQRLVENALPTQGVMIEDRVIDSSASAEDEVCKAADSSQQPLCSAPIKVMYGWMIEQLS